MLTHRDILGRAAISYERRIAVTGPDHIGLTYAELDAMSNRVANAMLTHGWGKGDRVVWIDANSADFLIAYYATAKIGATFTAINYWLRASEIAPQLSLIQPKMLVAGSEYADLAQEALTLTGLSSSLFLISAAREGWGSWRDDLLSGPADAITIPVSEDDLHEIIFTSGTTGHAKGVMRSQRKRIIDSFSAALAFELGRNDHMLWFLPQFHVGGASVAAQLLIQGGQVTILRRFDPAEVAAAIGRGVTYIVGVPAHYNLLFETNALAGVDTSSVRGCYVGGSAATAQLFSTIQEHFPSAELVHGYGSTESGPHSLSLRGQDFLDHFGALGLPVPGSAVRVVDPTTLLDVECGVVGELLVQSDAVMDGYLDRPDLTEQAFVDGWLRTGDLVVRDEQGYFRMIDRVKNIIITGGENVYPKEVEDVLAGHPAVAEAAVIGVPDRIFEERIIAYVRRSGEGAGAAAGDLIKHVRARLAGFKTPKELYFVDDFPRTGIGKIAVADLKAAYARERGEP
jgi:fatty-acyl-CoA synthase